MQDLLAPHSVTGADSKSLQHCCKTPSGFWMDELHEAFRCLALPAREGRLTSAL